MLRNFQCYSDERVLSPFQLVLLDKCFRFRCLLYARNDQQFPSAVNEPNSPFELPTDKFSPASSSSCGRRLPMTTPLLGCSRSRWRSGTVKRTEAGEADNWCFGDFWNVLFSTNCEKIISNSIQRTKCSSQNL